MRIKYLPAFALCTFLSLCALFTAHAPAIAQNPLAVTAKQPEGEIQHLTQIVVRFSENMRELGQMREDAATSPLQLTTAEGSLPPGEYRWLDTLTLAYLFEEPVEVPIRITAGVASGAKSLSGNTLAQGVSWQINTPAAVLSLAGHDSLPPKDAAFTLASNYALDPESLREKASLLLDGSALPIEISEITYGSAAAPSGNYRRPAPQGRQNRWLYRISVKAPLPADKTLILRLAPGIRFKKGGEPLAALDLPLASYRSLAIESWQTARQGDKGTVAPEHPLSVRFNNPVSRKDLLAHLEISPEALRSDDDEDSSRQDSAATWHTLPFQWQARTRYTLTIKPGLKDSYGTTLAKTESHSFTTGDFYPMLHMETGHKIMERPLKGIFPIHIRNIADVSIRVRHHAWSKAVLKAAASATRHDRPLEKLATAFEKQIDLDLAKDFNKNIRYELDIPKTLGYVIDTIPPGLTEIAVTTTDPDNPDRDGKPYRRTTTAFVQITSIGITAKTGVDEGLAWITDITTGAPIAGAHLTLADRDGTEHWTGRTDARGIVKLPGRNIKGKEMHYLIAQHDHDISILAADGNLDSSGTWNNHDSIVRGDYWRIAAITQLPLYQPGQQVNFTLYAKDLTYSDGGQRLPAADWRPLAGRKVRLVLNDSRGREIHRQEATTNAYGAISGSHTLSADAALGHYHFTLTRLDTNRSAGSNAFRVAVFRAPDFRVELDEMADTPNPPGRARPIAIGMKAAYFTGMPLAGAAATMNVTRQNENFTPARLAGYKTGAEAGSPFHPRSYYRYQPPEIIATLEATTDMNGATRFTLPDIAAKPGQPLRIGMEATVTDKAGLTTQGARGLLLHPSGSYVGIRVPRIILSGQKQHIELKAATFDNRPLSGVTVRLKAERITGRQAAGTEPETETIWQQDITIGKDSGQSLPAAFTKSGSYRITASITDESGRENISVAGILVPGRDLDWISQRTGKTLELLAEDIEHRPGDTARILVKNPYYDPDSPDSAKTTALVTIERENIRSHRFVEISGATYPLEVKVGKDDAPGIFVSVLMLKGRSAPPPAVGAADNRDTGAPRVRHGTQLIRVSREEPQLNVALTTGKTTWKPGETVTASVRVTDSAKRARQVQVTLLAVDSRVLYAAGEKTRHNPAAGFETIHVYGINSSDTRALLQNLSRISPRLMGGMAQKAAAPMAAQMRSQESAMDAGTTGDNSTASPLRRNFSPLAHWLAAGETDASGRLSTRFTLPDTLTSYRIVAIVADKTKQFGTQETGITATRPLQLLSALPRFATEGDALDARIQVQNTTRQRQTITVTAKAVSNLRLLETTKNITLDGQSSGLVSFPAQVLAPGTAALRVSGKTGSAGDAAEFTLPVMPAAPLTTVAAAGLLNEGETFTLPVRPPAGLDPRSRLAVILAASPAAGIPLAADAVISYPWDCLEQRMSRAWARAIRLKHGPTIALSPDRDDRKAIRETMSAADKFQKHDGGFALWPGMSGSGFYLTAYVLLVNSETKNLALALNAQTEQRAWHYLTSRLRASLADNSQRDRPLGDAEALALMLLAGQNPKEAAQLYPKALERTGDGKNISPLALGSLLTAARRLPEVPEQPQYTAQLVRTLEKTAQVTPVHLHFAREQSGDHWTSMGSTLRDNGMILGVLTKTMPQYPNLEALAAWTSQGLGSRKTLSTQEAVFGLWGLTTYLESLGGNRPVALTATWNNTESVTRRFTRLAEPPATWELPAEKLAGGKSGSLAFRASEGRPYWTARLTYGSPLVPARDETAGITIRRSWQKTGEKAGDAARWQVGDIIDVTITVTVPATRRHVLLFDPFPAGLEPLHATRIDLEDAQKQYQPPWQWEETRNDGMLLYTETLQAGNYVYNYRLRAVAPGKFIQRPTSAEEMYTPEVFGRTAGQTVTIYP